MEKPDLSGKKILFVLPPYDFCDEEYQQPKNLFEAWGARVVVASESLANARGTSGAEAKPDTTLQDIRVEDYDAIVLVGGIGSEKFWNDKTVHNVIIRAHRSARVVSASGFAVMIVANAGLLQRKRATGFPSIESFLQSKGVIYTDSPVETAGSIVTASGLEAIEEFAEAVAKQTAVINQNSV